ncbi:unnamed protein product [Zymoseptoria tritici ST99CH_3D1]|nr:unnamed protein product [Zymoseptoria tritici ST99CH_3D1]
MASHLLKLGTALLVLGVSASSSTVHSKRQASPELTDNERLLTNSISNSSISQYSFYYTQGLHLAGTNQSQAQYTADLWAEAGFDSRLDVYNVFLNYPLDNSLNATWSNGSVYQPELEEAVLKEDPVTGFPNRVPTFHAYSASGSVEAEYVYVGIGQIPDFERLLEFGVELKGKIALSRYGGPFRGLKVKNAQAYGMIGCIMFNDLADDRIKVSGGYLAYPDGPARNPTYVQRGTVLFLSTRPGDPTTPGYASKAGVPRTGRADVTPVIPSLPISYINAGPLLAALEGFGASGAEVNRSKWVGDYETGYYSGPAPGVTLGLSNLMNETYTDIWNAIGIINGTDPNEGAIIIGNHRDAWMIGGAGDPNSGTAALNEVAKAFGSLLKTGWKPKRTIVFASWDAEEYGMVGSTEFVEEYLPWLNASAATYTNFDSATIGPVPAFAGTPELHQITIETMKKVQWPRTSGTMYEAWSKQPQVLGAGSDYIAFVQNGFPTLDVGSVASPTSPIFMYHSNYDMLT